MKRAKISIERKYGILIFLRYQEQKSKNGVLF